MRIDLNADLGEGMGDDEALLGIVTSANVACGFHSGDEATARATCRAAAARGVAVGAHPSYRDRPSFGRRFLDVHPRQLRADVDEQLAMLADAAQASGTTIAHVKPHGALYNAIGWHEQQAQAVVDAVAAFDPTLPVLGLAGTVFARLATRAGLPFVAEAFADRGYLPTGELVPRTQPGAVLHDPAEVAARVVLMVTQRQVRAIDGSLITLAADSVCVHGDTPGAVALAAAVRRALEDAGVTLAPVRTPTASPATPRLLPCGEGALLFEFANLDAVLAAQAAAQAWAGAADIEDLVPAARTLLVVARDGALPRVRAAFPHLLAGVEARTAEPAGHESEPVEIPVLYDGPDLAEVAELTGLSVAEVIAAHTDTPWRVAFGGFAPGFAYLSGGDPRLHVPRRATPRTSVPASSVALAGPFSGVYPRASPGGWQLLGRTTVTLWDADRTPPALLRPGASVRFVPQRPGASVPFVPQARTKQAPAEAPGALLSANGAQTPSLALASGRVALTPGGRSIEVVAPGHFTLVQDRGRPGWRNVGVGSSGAADQAAFSLANRLVGNADDAAALEVTLGGLTLRVSDACCVAVTGAPLAVAVSDRAAPSATRLYLAAGDTLTLGFAERGLRSYVAISGGIDVPPVLGSRAFDTLAQLGPAPVRAGEVLPIGPQPTIPLDGATGTPPPLEGVVSLTVLPGPRADWVVLEGLFTTDWLISPRADRVGVRLEGPPLARTPARAGRELPSEPTMRGAVQVPPDGLPVIFGPDHPVTGGYPVVAMLTSTSSDALAQARPGQTVRFTRRRAPR